MIRKTCLAVLCVLPATLGWPWALARASDDDKDSNLKGPAAAQDSAKPDRESAVPAEDAALLKSLEKRAAADGAVEEEPLIRVGRRMRDVQGRLGQADAGEETRGIQKEIAEDLEKLIEELKKGGG
jgi:hypothetical protein